jgi:glycosyltransferase involved in cell wall biosynthesis
MDQVVTPLVMVKNDAYFLPYVLESVAGMFERMVIYDIGSTDGTKEIIEWFVEKEHDDTEFFVRYLPHCEPVVQGALRNSMIAEARTPIYMLLDGDELYSPDDVARIPFAAQKLLKQRRSNPRRRYGTFRRIEVNNDLTQKYSEERSHHRLYTYDAVWVGNHPGEAPLYAQNWKTQMSFMEEIAVLHLHNTLRSPDEKDVPKRVGRKRQSTYHPGTLEPFDLLEAYPILRTPILDWKVSPALKELQDAQ